MQILLSATLPKADIALCFTRFWLYTASCCSQQAIALAGNCLRSVKGIAAGLCWPPDLQMTSTSCRVLACSALSPIVRHTGGSGQASGTVFTPGGPGTQSSHQPVANGGNNRAAAPASQLLDGSGGLNGGGSSGLGVMDFHMESFPSLGRFQRCDREGFKTIGGLRLGSVKIYGYS